MPEMDIVATTAAAPLPTMGPELFRQAFENNPAGLAVVSVTGEYLQVNSRYTEIVGRSFDRIIGHSVHDVVPGYAEKALGVIRRVAETGSREVSVPFAGYLRGGKAFRHWLVSFSALSRGPEARVLLTVNEPANTGGVEAERHRELHFLFASFIEQSSDAIYVKAVDNTYRYINPAGARMLGKAVAEVIGKTDFDFFPREKAQEMWERDRFIMRGSLQGSTYEDQDYLCGRHIVFQSTKIPLRTVEGELIGIVGISRDITGQYVRDQEKRLLIAELAEAKAALEEERELKEALVANLGHDLRSPLMVAKLAAQFLSASEGHNPQEKQLLHKLSSSLERVDHMVRDLLDSSRLRAGCNVSLHLAPMELCSVLRSSTQELSLIYPGRVKAELPADPVAGRWDSTAVQRVLENLVHNAVRHGSPEGEVTIRAGLEAEESNAWFSVHNWGEPLAPGTLDQLSRRFERGHTCNRGLGGPGWGLGLAIVKSLVDGLGGSVRLESAAKHGTTFTIRIPRG